MIHEELKDATKKGFGFCNLSIQKDSVALSRLKKTEGSEVCLRHTDGSSDLWCLKGISCKGADGPMEMFHTLIEMFGTEVSTFVSPAQHTSKSYVFHSTFIYLHKLSLFNEFNISSHTVKEILVLPSRSLYKQINTKGPNNKEKYKVQNIKARG